MSRLIFLAALLSACATPRTHSIFSLQFSDMPPREAMRAVCNGKPFSTDTGVITCEEHEPSKAQIQVKVPPLEGRVVYSNGQLKKTEDFNWGPEQGIWFWKHKPINDTWIPLDLGDISATFGEWPVELNVMATEPSTGVIVTRGILYYRVCNDADIPCSKLVIDFTCSGVHKTTGAGIIEKCVRLSGSSQGFSVKLSGPEYKATAGGRLYIEAPRSNYAHAIHIGSAEIAADEVKFEIPEVVNGPAIVGMRLEWIEDGVRKKVEGRILIVGHDPKWTGIDHPHYILGETHTDWVKPITANLIEVDTYDGQNPINRKWTTDKVIESIDQPEDAQIQCGFAWSRDSSDLTVTCLNASRQEVRIP